jgi:hypothetical protein
VSRGSPTLLRASVIAALGLAACSDACVHERPGHGRAPLPEPEPMNLAELEAMLWPAKPDAWRPLSAAQLVALEQLVCLLVDQADDERSPARPRAAKLRRAQGLAKLVGVELHAVSLTHDGRSVELWVLVEPADDRRGRGSYLIRRGPAEPGAIEWLVQAPHSRFDKHTGALALRMFVEDDARSARALVLNSAHRYRQLDGSREPRRAAIDNPADAAHNPDHPIARVTAALLAARDLALVQLHGFSRSAEAGDPELILSAGAEQPSPASAAILQRLRADLPERAVGHYGVDTHRLGGLSNVQGQISRDARRCFVHVELSEPFRKQLVSDRELRRRFTSAVLDTEGLRGGCR